jgi:hypothetical protein
MRKEKPVSIQKHYLQACLLGIEGKRELKAVICMAELRITYPSSKCLHRFSATCALVLQLTHSSRNTIFLVVLAFFLNTGFVWPP